MDSAGLRDCVRLRMTLCVVCVCVCLYACTKVVGYVWMCVVVGRMLHCVLFVEGILDTHMTERENDRGTGNVVCRPNVSLN